MPNGDNNGLLEGFFEDQEGDFTLSERTALNRIMQDNFLYEMVARMMLWAYEEALNRKETNDDS